MPEGEPFPVDQPMSGGTVQFESEPFGLAVEITWRMWRNSLYDVMRELWTALGRAARHNQDVVAARVLNRAFNTSFSGFTPGESLCSTTHVGLDGVTRSNRPAVDIEPSVTYYQGAIERFETMTTEEGMPMVMAPVQAIVSPAFKWTAREVLGSGSKPYTTDNEMNPLIEEDITWMVSHYLVVNTYHFLLAAKGIHSLMFYWRDHPMPDSFDDPWTKNAMFTIYQAVTSGWKSWRGVDGSTGV
jgi:hypothetical protein